MAVYDYTCEACGENVEMWHPMSETREGRVHEKCGGPLRSRFGTPILVHDGSHVFTPKQLNFLKRDFKSVSYRRE